MPWRMLSPGTCSDTRSKPRRAQEAALRAAERAREVSRSPRERATRREAVITASVLASVISRNRLVNSAESRFSNSCRAADRARFASIVSFLPTFTSIFYSSSSSSCSCASNSRPYPFTALYANRSHNSSFRSGRRKA